MYTAQGRLPLGDFIATKKDVAEGVRRGCELAEFQSWLNTVDPDELKRWLADAFWKQQLTETELYRFFLLHKKGVDMRTIPEETHVA